MKNIDRIRAMSTEKLAEWLDECGAEPLDFCETCNLDIKCEDCPDEDWKQIWMKWLEREIGENEDRGSEEGHSRGSGREHYVSD